MASSVFVFLGSLMLIPWIIVRIPADYFVRDRRHRSIFTGGHPLWQTTVKIVRNTLGGFLICVGILLLVLPGQGLITIFMGMLLADFPGRRRLVNWLVTRPSICRHLNWIRLRAGRAPLQMPGEGESR